LITQDEKPEDAEKSKTDEKKDDKDTPAKKNEPSSETLPNLVRVTPAQLRHIEFPASGRYQPVRQVGVKSSSAVEATRAARSSATQQHVQGGGIIMMRDTKSSEPAEYIELTAKLDRTPPAPATAPTMQAAAGQTSTAAEGMDVDANEEEAPVPPPFEVCYVFHCIDQWLISSLRIVPFRTGRRLKENGDDVTSR
jgi:26S proteasome regulatory subunit N2